MKRQLALVFWTRPSPSILYDIDFAIAWAVQEAPDLMSQIKIGVFYVN